LGVEEEKIFTKCLPRNELLPYYFGSTEEKYVDLFSGISYVL
jgi:hypothetical protein